MIKLSFPFTEEKIRALKVGDEDVDGGAPRFVTAHPLPKL